MEVYFYWLIAAAVLLIVEIATAGFGVIFFSVGALVSALVAFFAPSAFTWQIVVFAIVSFLSFIFVRPVVMRFLEKRSGDVKTNADALLGRKAIVSETIDAVAHTGRVAIDGDDWKAVAESGTVIEKGSEVTVVGRDSIILTVR